MRVESSVTSITWIPSEAISGMPKMPFEMGIAHYDEPPPDRIVDLDALHENDLFREANELKAWIEVETTARSSARATRAEGRIGVTRIKLGRREIAFAAVQYPLLQAEPEVGDGWVKFVQSAGGHMGLPAPRRVSGKPFMRIKSSSAWTTLELIIYADGTSKHSLSGASPFPRHWIYDKDGRLVEKSGTIDFEKWYRESHGKSTPWGDEDSPALVTAVESELERELSASIMRSGAKLERRDARRGRGARQAGRRGQRALPAPGRPHRRRGGRRRGRRDRPRGAAGRASAARGREANGLAVRRRRKARVAVIPPDAIDESAMTELAARTSASKRKSRRNHVRKAHFVLRRRSGEAGKRDPDDPRDRDPDAAPATTGYGGYISLYDEAKGQAKAIVLWDSKETADANEAELAERRKQLTAGIGLTIESIELYEAPVVELEGARV